MRFFFDRIRVLTAAAGMILLSCCAVREPLPVAKLPVTAVDSFRMLVKTGDIVLRSGNDAISELFRNFNRKDKTWSHCGVVVIENDYPFVYHCIGGEDNPQQQMLRDSIAKFVDAAKNLAAGIVRYELDSVIKTQFVQQVKRYYGQHVLFDLNFDLSTDDKLYCAEMIYKSFLHATGDTTFMQPYKHEGFRYVAVEQLAGHPLSRLIWQVHY